MYQPEPWLCSLPCHPSQPPQTNPTQLLQILDSYVLSCADHFPCISPTCPQSASKRAHEVSPSILYPLRSCPSTRTVPGNLCGLKLCTSLWDEKGKGAMGLVCQRSSRRRMPGRLTLPCPAKRNSFFGRYNRSLTLSV